MHFPIRHNALHVNLAFGLAQGLQPALTVLQGNFPTHSTLHVWSVQQEITAYAPECRLFVRLEPIQMVPLLLARSAHPVLFRPATPVCAHLGPLERLEDLQFASQDITRGMDLHLASLVQQVIPAAALQIFRPFLVFQGTFL